MQVRPKKKRKNATIISMMPVSVTMCWLPMSPNKNAAAHQVPAGEITVRSSLAQCWGPVSITQVLRWHLCLIMWCASVVHGLSLLITLRPCNDVLCNWLYVILTVLFRAEAITLCPHQLEFLNLSLSESTPLTALYDTLAENSILLHFKIKMNLLW